MSKRLTDLNLTAVRQIGFTANRRLLGVQRISHDPLRGAQAFTKLTAPIVTDTRTRIPGLRFGDARVHTLLQPLLIHRLLPHGSPTVTCAPSSRHSATPRSRTSPPGR